jgi:hypothetical protein
MVSIDADTLTVGVLAPFDEDSDTVIRSGMRAGQNAPIPLNVNTLTRRFDDLANSAIILAIALWQRNQSPDHVVQAGFDAFTSSLNQAVSGNLLALSSKDKATQEAAIRVVKDAVRNKVTSAISNSLTLSEKIQIETGFLTLDSIIDDSSHPFTDITSNPSFSIHFGQVGGPDEYEIDCGLSIALVLCAAEEARVNTAQTAVDNLNAKIEELQKQLDNASPTQKPALIKKIGAQQLLLARAEDKLDEAKAALAACRAHSGPGGGLP